MMTQKMKGTCCDLFYGTIEEFPTQNGTKQDDDISALSFIFDVGNSRKLWRHGIEGSVSFWSMMMLIC